MAIVTFMLVLASLVTAGQCQPTDASIADLAASINTMNNRLNILEQRNQQLEAALNQTGTELATLRSNGSEQCQRTGDNILAEMILFIDTMDNRLIVLDQMNQQLESALNQSSDLQTVETIIGGHEMDARLYLLEQEVNQTKQALTDQLTELTQLKASHDDTTRQQIGFSASLLLSETPSYNTPLIVNNVLYNAGNAYDNTTGFFTASVPGVYFFTATTTTSPTDHSIFFWLFVDNTQLSWAAAAGSYDSATVHTVVHLTAGQRMCLRSGGSTYSSGGTTFSGALLSPDP